ncbi:hypothetical protein GCM10010372_67590 [Streptomyces tauricus]|nr:hypothetical protein GCM10010372_67590 [Streptomyces tauricus]
MQSGVIGIRNADLQLLGRTGVVERERSHRFSLLGADPASRIVTLRRHVTRPVHRASTEIYESNWRMVASRSVVIGRVRSVT